MKNIIYTTLATLLVLLILVGTLIAQEQADIAKGLVPYGSYKGGDIDSVSMTNGNVVLHIPLYSVPQKGKYLHENHIIYYNDKHWTVSGGSGNNSVGTYAPILTTQGVDDETFQGVYVMPDYTLWPLSSIAYISVSKSDGNLGSSGITQYYYVTPDGSQHYYSASVEAPSAASGSYSNTFPTVDGSGFIPTSTGVRDYNGSLYNLSSGMVDPNGVALFNTNGGNIYTTASYTDSYGRTRTPTAQLSTSAAGQSLCAAYSATAKVYVDHVPSDSGDQVYYYCYQELPGATNYGKVTNSGETVCANGSTHYTALYDGGSTEYRITAIILPNGTTYEFSYDAYLSLASVKLPTNGSISYSWQNVQFGECPTRALATRTVSDGATSHTWKYTWVATTPYSQTPNSSGSTPDPIHVITGPLVVTDPDNNDEVHYVSGGNDPQIDSWQGCSGLVSTCTTQGTLLKSVRTTYQRDIGTEPAYIADVLGSMETGVASTVPASVKTMLYQGGSPAYTSEKDYTYVSSGGYTMSSLTPLVTAATCTALGSPTSCTVSSTSNYVVGFNQLQTTTEHDFGSGTSAGTAVRTTEMHYKWQDNSALIDLGLVGLVNKEYKLAGAQTVEGGGTPLDEEDTTFDLHGNPTQVVRNGLSLATYTYGNGDGMVTSSTDAANNVTTHTYGACNGALPTETITPSGLTVYGGYNCDGGHLTSFTDANSQPYSYTYDEMGRITGATHPDNGTITFIYDDNNLTVDEIQSSEGSAKTDLRVQFDGLGREIHRATQLNSSQWRESDISYDAKGRKSFVTYPYIVSTPWGSSSLGDSFAYDAFSRTTSVTHSDGTSVVNSYTGPAVRVTDESGKARVSQSDGLGRLAYVCEVTASTLGGTAPASCSPMADNPTGYLTAYGYDPLDNLLSVSQGSLLRSFTYDNFSRLTKAINPESGTINYQYYPVSSRCSGDISALCNKTDARSITTTYAYDNEHRLTAKSYSDGTPSACFTYGGPAADTSNYTAGRLVSEWTSASGCASSSGALTTRAIAYNLMGGVASDTQKNTYTGTNSYGFTYQYNYLGGVTISGDTVSTGVSYTFTHDLAGELTQATTALGGATSPTNLLTNVSYGKAGLTSATLGSNSGVAMLRGYDNRNRLISETDTGGIYTAAVAGSASLTVTGSEQSVGTSTASTGTVTVSGSEQKLDLGTSSSGSFNISGTEQSAQVQTAAATKATGSIVVAGSQHSTQVTTPATSGSTTILIGSNSSYQSVTANMCPTNPYATCYVTIPNAGGAVVVISGTTYSAAYTSTSTTSTVASDLATSINSGSLATAVVSGSSVIVTAKTTGTASNYTVTTSCSYNTSYFSGCGYYAIASSLTGGKNAVTNTVYDAGTASATVNSQSFSYAWSGSSATATTIASGLASAINSGSSSVTASPVGGTITLTSQTAGAATNYALSSSITYDTTDFTSAAFSIASGSALSGGKDATYKTVYNTGAVTLTVNGTAASYTYGQNDTLLTIASGLAAKIGTGCSPYSVSATVSANQVLLTSCSTGASVNYTLVGSSTTSDSTNFPSGSSFTATASGSAMTGGKSTGGTVFYDAGTATIIVNSQVNTYSWSGSSTTASSIASGLAAAINGSSSSSVTATVSGGTITLTSKLKGASYNYSLSSTTSYDTTHFSAASFALTASGGTMVNGSDHGGTTMIYDTGTVTLTVNGTSQSYTYGQSDTASTVASGLASAFSGNAQVSVSASGAVLTIKSKTAGAATNYRYSLASATTNSTYFSTGSYTTASGTLAGGADAHTTAAETVYSYALGYASNSDIMFVSDSVMGQSGITSMTCPDGKTYTSSFSAGWGYCYNDLNSLSTATAADGRTLAWSYDRYGNVSQSGTLPHVQTYSRGNNQIDGYVYDASGNITAYTDPVNGATAMSYDAESRVASVSGGGGAASYVYDAEGRRVAKLNTSGAATAVYLLGLGGEQVIELNGSGAVQHRNVYAGGKLLASYDASSNLHLHLDDWLGTRRAQTSASGTLEMTYQSFPFGDGYSATCVSGTCTDPTENHFTGKEHDTESGNDYFEARYYSSTMGRFMSPDWSAQEEPVPYADLEDPQSLNLYLYMQNNPLGGVDADGHLPPWIAQKVQQGKQWAADHPRTMQAAGGITKAAVGIGLVATIAGGDVPGSIVGVGLVVSGTISATASIVSGITDLAGAATNTNVEAAQKGLDSVSGVPALVTTAATGNPSLGSTVGTLSDAAQLAAKPQEALKNAATMADAVKTGAGAADLVKGALSTPAPPSAPKPPPPPSCSVAGACK